MFCLKSYEHFEIIINEHFASKHHQMQETCNHYFGLKQCKMLLHQTKIGKHEYNKTKTCTVKRFNLINKIIF